MNNYEFFKTHYTLKINHKDFEANWSFLVSLFVNNFGISPKLFALLYNYVELLQASSLSCHLSETLRLKIKEEEQFLSLLSSEKMGFLCSSSSIFFKFGISIIFLVSFSGYIPSGKLKDSIFIQAFLCSLSYLLSRVLFRI